MPFYFVSLTHATWEEAAASARLLPPEAVPELRLDLFPEEDIETMVRGLGRRCLVSCRRVSEGGRWPDEEEATRQTRLEAAAEARPSWLDWEWDLEVPAWLQSRRSFLRLLRSVHVKPGVFDLEARLRDLPPGDAYKWVGVASRLPDNQCLKAPLAWARDRHILLSAFLMGPKGIPGRCLQAAWGGAFTYAAPDDGPPAAPGQLSLETLRGWRCHRLHGAFGLCGVLGSPVLHSRSPAFHNARFQRNFKDLLYLPLECGDPEEAFEALEALEILGASLTAPLKESLPARLGMEGPLNTLWRRSTGDPWQGANTDREALGQSLSRLDAGPVLVLGSGGTAQTSLDTLREAGRPCLQVSRRAALSPAEVAAFGPVGIIQATSLGMNPGDPLPFPEQLEAARPALRWAVEWIYKEDTAFAAWAREAGLHLVEGSSLFDAQAAAQSLRFVAECGG